MTLLEFKALVNLEKLLEDYFKPEKRLENALNNISFNGFALEATEVFEENKTSIMVDFFNNVNYNLFKEKYELLLVNFSILLFNPFTSEHIGEIRKIYKSTNDKIEKSNLNPDLLNFYWTFLDHIYHEDIMDQFDNEIIEAKKILKNITLESEEKNLLLQKIEQHYRL